MYIIFYIPPIGFNINTMPNIQLLKTKKRDKTFNKVKYQSIYNTNRWVKLRDYKLSINPLCEVCLDKGIIKQTEEVHHIIPFNINPDLAYDINNLKSVCIECHKELHIQLHDKYHNMY